MIFRKDSHIFLPFDENDGTFPERMDEWTVASYRLISADGVSLVHA